MLDKLFQCFLYTQVTTPTRFEFALISDMDLDSRDAQQFVWKSYLQKGEVTRLPNGKYDIKLGERLEFRSDISRKNRSMELSALRLWNGKLYGFCDYTGIVFELDLKNQKAYPRWILTGGDGMTDIPLKAEWSTLKDNTLYVGTIGKEWVVNNKIIHKHCEWVTIIYPNGEIVRQNWRDVFQMIRKATKTEFPGYILHEAVFFDPDLRMWIFLPRKASDNIPYSEEADETLGTNMLIFVNEQLTKVVDIKRVGPLEKTYGFSDLVKLPGTNHHYMAVKVAERVSPKYINSKIVVFDSQGNILSPWVEVGAMKFEGVEILKAE